MTTNTKIDSAWIDIGRNPTGAIITLWIEGAVSQTGPRDLIDNEEGLDTWLRYLADWWPVPKPSTRCLFQRRFLEDSSHVRIAIYERDAAMERFDAGAGEPCIGWIDLYYNGNWWKGKKITERNLAQLMRTVQVIKETL